MCLVLILVIMTVVRLIFPLPCRNGLIRLLWVKRELKRLNKKKKMMQGKEKERKERKEKSDCYEHFYHIANKQF